MQQEMMHERIRLQYKDAYGYTIPVGSTVLLAAVTEDGMIGTAGFDIEALENLGIPAAVVHAGEGIEIERISDLLDGEVVAANLHATQRRVEVGMSGREALERM
ncbi:DUF1805 domain-containing protein [Methanoculleus sp. FWC-SCC1]|uniref:DUF1805 domain-containing protein n=1 Tax=Methanoculleus frigidifontis TaxID=2584085 RepID=A0ABT8MA52_9EURY|nr:DUF1805 domain-containing protein [Methanoculleus sp. FWC-SCC1]MDN7024817.1 DUF1805 domain-containing protein [Methanoculleus sp. FWC-SCC1]